MPDNEKRVSAFLLPDKIIIEAINQKGPGSWNSSGNFTVLPIGVSDIKLGEFVLFFLSQSSEKVESYEQVKKNWKELLKKVGYKTEKDFIKNVKRVVISKADDEIIFAPYKVNISQKTFYRLPDLSSKIFPIPQTFRIGELLRKSWESCFFIDG